MKNKIFIHKNGGLNKIYQNYFIALFPLIIYGLYKNGILLYLDHSITFIDIFKPLVFPVLGMLLGLTVNFVLNREFKFNPLVLYGLIVGMIIPINTSIILFIAGMLGSLFLIVFLEKKVSFNIVCFVKIAIIGLLIIFKNYEYANVTELSQAYAFSFIDMLFGRGIGGVCSSSIIWIIIGFVYLIMDYYYKKEIPVYAIVSYSTVTLLSYLFIKDINLIINYVFASSVWFAFVFVAPISDFSSYTPKGKLIFGISIGILTGIIAIFLNTLEAPIIAIFVVSLLKDLIDKIGDKKLQNKSFT